MWQNQQNEQNLDYQPGRKGTKLFMNYQQSAINFLGVFAASLVIRVYSVFNQWLMILCILLIVSLH